jgi:hypothetical protein
MDDPMVKKYSLLYLIVVLLFFEGLSLLFFGIEGKMKKMYKGVVM